MKEQQLSNWRENITADLTEVKTDVKWIKENLGRVGERQDSLTRQVSWLRGVGSLVGVVLGSGLASVINIIMR